MLKMIDMDPANENLTGYYSNATGTGPFTMSATNSGDDLAHQVSLRNDSANSKSGITFTLTGTDADGRPQVETLAGPGSSATVESTKYFLTLTTVAVSATLGADTVDIGWVDEVASPTYELNWRLNAPSYYYLDVTGTCSIDVQFTISDTTDRRLYTDQNSYKWFIVSASLDDETADSTAAIAIAAGYTGFRIISNSYSSGAEWQTYVSQPEIPAY